MTIREWLTRCGDLFRRNRLDRELSEELEFHARQLERRAEDEGRTVDEAKAVARRRLGHSHRIMEETRDLWSFAWLDHLRQDLRFAWRGLRRSPAFTGTVVLMLSLGIGANVVMFGVVDRLMFKPLDHLRDPSTVHRLYLQTVDRGAVNTSIWVQADRYRAFLEGTSSFAQMACINERLMAIGTGEATREVRVAGVTASYFDFFEMTPAAGRFFRADEDVAPAGAPVAVLAHGFWQREFGGRPVIGERLPVGSIVVTVIGVAPPGFTGLDDAQVAQIFLPLTTLGPAMGGQAATRFSQGYNFLWGTMVVRRKPGVSVEQASADATAAYRASWERQRAEQPPGPAALRSADEAQPRVVVSALRTGRGPNPSLDARTSVWVSGVAALLLVIAIANVASLLLGRTLERRQETAVRLALGVSRRRLFAHLLTESVVLAALGALGAVLVTYWAGAAVHGLLTAATGPVPGLIDTRTLLATALLAALVALTTGLLPAWMASRASTAPSIRSGTRDVARGTRVRSTLVVVQGALSFALIVGALLFVRSLAAVRATDLGYDADRILMVDQVLRGTPLDPAARVALRGVLLDAARALPVVEAAAWRSSTPMGTTMRIGFGTDSRPSVADLGLFSAQEATADYFQVMGTQIVNGRGFSEEDRAGAPPVAVVSESAARALWPGQDPLGQCLRVGRPPAPCTAIIGVAQDIRANSFTETDLYQVYFPIEQTSPAGGSGLVLRVHGDSAAAAESVRRALQPLMPGISYLNVRPMEGLLERPQRSWHLGATMFGVFGALALVVAAIGLYGVISYSVAQRRREVGVRLALGAGRSQILWLVTRQGLAVAAAGVGVGMALALLFSGRVQPLLFSQSARDPRVFVLAVVVLLVVAAAATLVPAVRASRTNPTDVLRGE